MLSFCISCSMSVAFRIRCKYSETDLVAIQSLSSSTNRWDPRRYQQRAALFYRHQSTHLVSSWCLYMYISTYGSLTLIRQNLRVSPSRRDDDVALAPRLTPVAALVVRIERVSAAVELGDQAQHLERHIVLQRRIESLECIREGLGALLGIHDLALRRLTSAS